MFAHAQLATACSAVMDDDLVCNFKKCRKRITNIAWVRTLVGPS